MILATLSTGSFDFVALGNDEDHARRVMAKAWRKHKRQTGASLTVAEILEDTNFMEIKPGTGIRDHSALVEGVK